MRGTGAYGGALVEPWDVLATYFHKPSLSQHLSVARAPGIITSTKLTSQNIFGSDFHAVAAFESLIARAS